MKNNESRHTDKYRLDANWLMAQRNRPDGEERVMAFYESIRDAIITDSEYWGDIGQDVFIALATDDTAALLVALCGWGPKNLARYAWLMRSDAQDLVHEIPGTLMVDWDDEQRTSCPCVIRNTDHRIGGLDYSIFIRDDAPMASIQNVLVRFHPFTEENEYEFQCVSQAQRVEAEDDEIFWYPPKGATE